MAQGAGNKDAKSKNPERNANKPRTRVIDFTEVREKKLEEKRRRTERIFFKNLINVFSVSGTEDAHPMDLLELSEEGCSFQTPSYPGQSPWPTKSESVPIRLYFSRDTYLEVFVNIVNSKATIEDGKRFIRYGCQIDQQVQSYQAYLAFVKFLRLYAEHAYRDMGDVSAFYV